MRKRVLPLDVGARIMGRLLRDARGARSLSTVATAAGTSTSVICDVEHARLLPSEPKLRNIFCRGCGLSDAEFQALMFDFRLDFFLQADDALSPADRSRIRRFVRALRPAAGAIQDRRPHRGRNAV